MGNSRRFRYAYVAALALTGMAGCVVPDPPPPGPGVTAKILPALPGYPHALATDINDRGEAVGWSLGPQGSYAKAVLWRDGRAVDLRPLGPATSFAYFVNERSQVLLTEATGLNTRTYLWDAGKATDLTGDAQRSLPIDLNDNGQALIRRSFGAFLSPPETDKVGVWSNGTFTQIVPPTGNGSISTASVLKLMNDGSVVGSFADDHPFVWRNGQYTYLAEKGRVIDANERGQVLGTVRAGSQINAVIWQGGGTTTLAPEDGVNFLPERVSSDGRVAGQRGAEETLPRGVGQRRAHHPRRRPGGGLRQRAGRRRRVQKR